MAVVQTVAEPTRHRFSVADYYAMDEAGILGPEDRVELIEGDIYDTAAIGPGHGFSVDEMSNEIKERLGRRVRIRTQGALRVDDFSEPEPDLLLLRPRGDRYRGRQPTAADTLLLVEVAQTSLSHDRRRKLPLYARASVPEVWIVNLVNETIETWADPVEGRYTTERVYRRGEKIAPRAFPDCQLEVDEILG